MWEATGRQNPENSGFCGDFGGRIAAGAARTLAVAAIVFASQSAVLSQNKTVPIPRPSPLGTGETSPDTATAASDPSLPTPDGLSPGALLDPTRGADAGADAEFAARPGNEEGIGGPLQLAPDALNEPAYGGSNPLLGVAPPTAAQVRFVLEAQLQADGSALPSGITWRVFAPHPGPDGKLPLIGEARGGAIEVRLAPGEYLVHAAYGRAGATKKISVNPGGGSDKVVINAGGLKLSALVGNDEPLTLEEVSFDIYAPDEDGSDERVLLVPDAPPEQVIGLNAGIYHVICRYGDANAVVRADIRVDAGKLTEATIYQKAARLTLKLVSAHGGEALANTSWTIITPQGDSVVESVGAFPSVVLASGDYTAVASHQGRNYERNFTVEAGLDRDVEVIAK
jgi:hypothetical protein